MVKELHLVQMLLILVLHLVGMIQHLQFLVDSAVTVPGGSYVVAATFPTGCVLYSDTLEVISAVEDSLPQLT